MLQKSIPKITLYAIISQSLDVNIPKMIYGSLVNDIEHKSEYMIDILQMSNYHSEWGYMLKYIHNHEWKFIDIIQFILFFFCILIPDTLPCPSSTH